MMEENVLKMRSAKWFIKINIYIEQTVIQIHLFHLLKYKFFIRILYNLWVTKQDQLLLGEGVNISAFQEGGLNIGSQTNKNPQIWTHDPQITIPW